jgi:hypothetical protein
MTGQSRSIDALLRIALPAASAQQVHGCMAWIEIGAGLLELQNASRTPGNSSLMHDTRGLLRQMLNLTARSARIAEIASLLKHVAAAGTMLAH